MLLPHEAPDPTRTPRWPLPRAADVFHLGDGWPHARVGPPPARPDAAVTPVHAVDTLHGRAVAPARALEPLLEAGTLLHLPQLPFPVRASEQRFLHPCWADRRSDRITVRGAAGALRGATGPAADRADLRALLLRFAAHAQGIADALFPHYRGRLRPADTAYRPLDVAARDTGWRRDDTRLHVDAFPAEPLHGARLLRVCTNVDPAGRPRHWRVGEPFAAHARRYLASLTRPLPGAAWVLTTVGMTSRRRSEYDHVMLQLHDHAKGDLDFQRTSPQADLAFAAGDTWVLFGDQVPHAAMAGRHLLEQAFHLDVEHLQRPETSPLHTLERLLHRRLR